MSLPTVVMPQSPRSPGRYPRSPRSPYGGHRYSPGRYGPGYGRYSPGYGRGYGPGYGRGYGPGYGYGYPGYGYNTGLGALGGGILGLTTGLLAGSLIGNQGYSNDPTVVVVPQQQPSYVYPSTQYVTVPQYIPQTTYYPTIPTIYTR